MTEQQMLQIDNLHAAIGDTPILKGLSLTGKAAKVHAMVGPNGAGVLAYSPTGGA